MEKSKISIIIPIFNSDNYIRKTLESLREQTLSDIEIICVDDGSSDCSIAIVKEFCELDCRIKLIEKEENSGVSSSRNIGLNNSNSEFVMFLDSDDSFEKTMCEKMYKKMVEEDLNLVICNANTVLDPNFMGSRDYNRDRNYAAIGSHMVWNKIFRKKLIDEFNLRFPEDVKGGEDVYFTICYKSICNDKIGILDDKLYNYLIRDGSLMSCTKLKDADQMLDCFKISEHVYNFFKTTDQLNKVYQIYFANIRFGIKNFTEKRFDEIARIISDNIKNKKEIIIGNDCFYVNGEKYRIEPQAVFDRILSSSLNMLNGELQSQTQVEH